MEKSKKEETEKSKKEAYKSKKRKKKGWFSGLGSFGFGSTEDTKGNVGESAKQGAILVVGTLAGGLAGAAIGGATALYGGIFTTLGGLFMGSDAIASAGGGMMIGSAVKPTPVQNANLQQKNAEADMSIDKTRNQLATGASAFLQNIKENSLVNKVLPKPKDEEKPKETANTTTKVAETTPKTDAISGLGMIGKQGSNDVSMLGNIPDYQKSFRNVGVANHSINNLI